MSDRPEYVETVRAVRTTREQLDANRAYHLTRAHEPHVEADRYVVTPDGTRWVCWYMVPIGAGRYWTAHTVQARGRVFVSLDTDDQDEFARMLDAAAASLAREQAATHTTETEGA